MKSNKVLKYLFELSADLFDSVCSLGINYEAQIKAKRLDKNEKFDFWKGLASGPIWIHSTPFVVLLFIPPVLLVAPIYVSLLMLTGKIARYCIGYPLGALVGGIAAGINWLANTISDCFSNSVKKSVERKRECDLTSAKICNEKSFTFDNSPPVMSSNARISTVLDLVSPVQSTTNKEPVLSANSLSPSKRAEEANREDSANYYGGSVSSRGFYAPHYSVYPPLPIMMHMMNQRRL